MKIVLEAEIVGMFFGLLIALAAVLTEGCAVNAHHHDHGMPVVTVQKPHRCQRLGQSISRNASVLIERNCFRNGVTTVGIVVHNTRDNGKLAARDSARAIKRILGFHPRLVTLFLGKTSGQVFMLSTVVDGSEGPVAARER
jgi:hypothetical protein